MNASGNVEVIPNKEGQKTTPSGVAFTKTGEKLVGVLAKRQAVTNPDGTVVHIKRKMGSDYKVTVNGKSYTPQQISAFILQKAVGNLIPLIIFLKSRRYLYKHRRCLYKYRRDLYKHRRYFKNFFRAIENASHIRAFNRKPFTILR